MLKRSDFFVCLALSAVLHLLSFCFLFGFAGNKAFLSVPIDVSFYYLQQTELLDKMSSDENENIEYENADKPLSIEDEESFSPKDQEEEIKIKKVLENKPLKKQAFIEEKTETKANKNKKSIEQEKNEIFTSKTDKQNKVENEFLYDAVRFDDKNFKYGYYIRQIVEKIRKHWRWSKSNDNLRALAYFRICRDGNISDVSIKEASGNTDFDKDAENTVYRAIPFAELPKDYQDDYLGVFFEFKYGN
jgi:outer membrane biosynthesis protein TonB